MGAHFQKSLAMLVDSVRPVHAHYNLKLSQFSNYYHIDEANLQHIRVRFYIPEAFK